MLDITELGWDPKGIAGPDYKRIKSFYARIISYTSEKNEDAVYIYNLRVIQPNFNYLAIDLPHSFEHYLLTGFKNHLGNNIINIAPIGCQTGFYLVVLNIGNREKIYKAYENILLDTLNMKTVPYVNIKEYGQYVFHNIIAAKKFAQYLLNSINRWKDIF